MANANLVLSGEILSLVHSFHKRNYLLEVLEDKEASSQISHPQHLLKFESRWQNPWILLVKLTWKNSYQWYSSEKGERFERMVHYLWTSQTFSLTSKPPSQESYRAYSFDLTSKILYWLENSQFKNLVYLGPVSVEMTGICSHFFASALSIP